MKRSPSKTKKVSDTVSGAKPRMGTKTVSDTNSGAKATLVFVGPTLLADEVRRLLPDAEILPPAAVGDILRAAGRRDVARIALIDGYFERMAAVWHKEILVALEAGIEVWGAASMGALRAAELADFGMIGVGAIFDAYRRGALGGPEAETSERELASMSKSSSKSKSTSKSTSNTTTADTAMRLVADDEVAVAHAPAEFGYRAVTDALVNIRHGLSQAVREGVIGEADRVRLVDLARGRFYRERTWAQLIDDARRGGDDGRGANDGRGGHGGNDGRGAIDERGGDGGIDERVLAALAAWPKPDLKAADARMLLRKLRRSGARKPRIVRVPRTWALRQLRALL